MYGLVIEQEERISSNGKPYWQVTTRTKEGELKCMMWDAVHPFNNPLYPQRGDYIFIKEFRDQREDRNNIVIRKFERITQQELPVDELPYLLPARATEQQLKDAKATIFDKSLYRDESFFNLVFTCYAAVGNVAQTCPAAKSMHHAFQGGLLVHTAELVKICKGVVAAFPYPAFINSDLIYAGASLHDIGKVCTYGFDNLGANRSVEEDTVGHIFHSMRIVSNGMDSTQFNKDQGNELLHIIAAHHGRLEHGSIKVPMTLEADIVHQADYLSSRCGMLHVKMKEYVAKKIPFEGEIKFGSDKLAVTTALDKAYESHLNASQ